jgi:hypothetical protein
MSNTSITTIISALIYLSDCIFTGAKFFVPVMFMLRIIRLDKWFDFKTLVISVNTIVLFGGILFLITVLMNLLLPLRSGNPDELKYMLSIVTGKNWFQFQLPVACFALLPLIFLWKKYRSSFNAILLLVMFWYFCFFLNYFFSWHILNSKVVFSFNAIECFEKAGVFTGLILFVYFFLKKFIC